MLVELDRIQEKIGKMQDIHNFYKNEPYFDYLLNEITLEILDEHFEGLEELNGSENGFIRLIKNDFLEAIRREGIDLDKSKIKSKLHLELGTQRLLSKFLRSVFDSVVPITIKELKKLNPPEFTEEIHKAMEFALPRRFLIEVGGIDEKILQQFYHDFFAITYQTNRRNTDELIALEKQSEDKKHFFNASYAEYITICRWKGIYWLSFRYQVDDAICKKLGSANPLEINKYVEESLIHNTRIADNTTATFISDNP